MTTQTPRRSLTALLIALSAMTVSACGEAAPAGEDDPAADELSLFPARRFDSKPGMYVGKTVRVALLRRGDELLAEVSTRGDQYGGRGAVEIGLTFFGVEKAKLESKPDGAEVPGLSLELVAKGVNIEVSGRVGALWVNETLALRPLSAWAGTFRNPEANATLRIETPTDLGATLSTVNGTTPVRWRDPGVALLAIGDTELSLSEDGIYWYGREVWLRE